MLADRGLENAVAHHERIFVGDLAHTDRVTGFGQSPRDISGLQGAVAPSRHEGRVVTLWVEQISIGMSTHGLVKVL